MIALSTGSLYTYGLSRVFQLAAEAGYDGIEVLVDQRWDTRHPAYLRRLSADYDLPIVAVHNPFVVHVPDWPDDQLGRLRETVGLAQAVGAPLVVVHLPFRFPIITGHLHAHRPRRFFLPLPLPRREPYYHFLHDGQLAALEAEQGIVVAVENMPSKRFLGLTYSPYRFNSRAELARFPHLTLDTTHLGTWGIDPAAFYEHLRDRVAHVHLSNFDGREHRSPPDGALALEKLLRLLARDGYRGAVTVECGPAALDACDEDACLDALRRALAFCREHYAFDDNV